MPKLLLPEPALEPTDKVVAGLVVPMPTDPLLVAKLAPRVLLTVVNAPVDGVVAPMAVEFRPVEESRIFSTPEI